MAFHKYILNEFFSSMTLFGSPVFYVFFIFILFAFKVPFALNLSLAIIFVELFCAVIKLVYHKERPNPQLKKNFYDKIDANSFPSVHSTRIALIVAMFCLYYKNPLIFIVGTIVVLGVGYSRIYLKRHYFLDVLAGFLIGITTAIIAFNI